MACRVRRPRIGGVHQAGAGRGRSLDDRDRAATRHDVVDDDIHDVHHGGANDHVDQHVDHQHLDHLDEHDDHQ